MEFWIATVMKSDGLHWSSIVWGDGAMHSSEALEEARQVAILEGFGPDEVRVHGPYTLKGGIPDGRTFGPQL